MDLIQNLHNIKSQLPEGVSLVAVSKTKPSAMIQTLYDAGQRIFGENKVQDLKAKWEELPKDIEWHMIGHLQTNKVKYIAPFVALIHGVDSLKLAKEIDKRARQNDRIQDILLQVNISNEPQKNGFLTDQINAGIEEISLLKNVNVVGLMGMATHTDDQAAISKEFAILQEIYQRLKPQYALSILSSGMSHDFPLAIEHGATHVRVGSSIFGARSYT